MENERVKKIFILALYTIMFFIAAKFIYDEFSRISADKLTDKGGIPQALKHYRKEVDSLAAVFRLPPDYLMALIMLECSGRKKVPVRFEKRIYQKLKHLQDGKISQFENMKKSDLKGVKDKTLRKLASSHGPFQIMGYKKYILQIPLDSLTGKKNMYYAIKWINLSYGDLLRKSDYKDAFHIHNTGKPYPMAGKPFTHDPAYVEKGLAYQKYFKYVIYKSKSK
jgi:hypothetical protein